MNNLRETQLWLLFCAYSACVAIGLYFHEPWGDELQTWGLIKNSGSLSDLIANSRLDGHPPLWYLVEFVFSRFGNSYHTLQITAFFFSVSVAFLFIFYSWFPFRIKVLVLGGYFFLYEYALFSRNYFIILLVAFLICINLKANYKYKNWVYYLLLFLLCNTHFYAIWLVLAFHLYFLMTYKERTGVSGFPLKHTIIGAMVVCLFVTISLLFSSIAGAPGMMLKDWDVGRFTMTAQIPLRAFFPIPAGWRHYFWNTNALWDGAGDSPVLKLMALVLSVLALSAVIVVFFKNKAVLLFFICVAFLMFFNSQLFPITNARHVGIMYMAFLVALWLSEPSVLSDSFRRRLIYIILTLQIPGTVISLSKDINYPFSQINQTDELISLVPPDQTLITDFWSLVYLNAVDHKSYYCIESGKEQSFLKGGKDWNEILSDPHRYTYGIDDYLLKKQSKEVFFICIFSPLKLYNYDSYFYKTFKVELIAARVGALEPYSDLYLYKIRKRD